MPDKEIFVLKIVWKKSIASLQHLTQAVQRTNLRRTAGDPTWVYVKFSQFELLHNISSSYTLFFFVCYASKSEIRVWSILKNFYPKSIEINLLHCHLKIVASNLSVLENCFRIAACVFFHWNIL